MRIEAGLGAALLASAGLFAPAALPADAVPVRYTEGIAHGFLTLSTPGGKRLADGDLIQTARADRVTSRVVLQFRDGSVHDETVVFSQKDHFRLLRNHLVQTGPSFPRSIDMLVDAEAGEVRIRYAEDGEAKTVSDRPELPADLANGLVLTLLKNVRPDSALTTVSLLAATPKPRLVRLRIAPAGEDSFSIGASRRAATHYVVKVEIGGIAGLIAPLIGKQPLDSHVWILGGDAPTFVKSEGPFYDGGPPWRLELTNPVWPAAPSPTP